MTKLDARILLLLPSFLLSLAAQSQCQVTITPSATTVPCGGGQITLTANGNGYQTTPLDNDFDAGNAGPGWNVSPAGQFNNPCDPSVDGGTYMWMGNTTAAPRTLETAPLDLSCGGQVCFYLDFSTQGGAAPCEGPDLTNEGVYFEYSTDGGATWTTINYFQPNAGGAAGAITQWAQYCYPIPAAAQTTNTIFHWFQDGSSGTCCDHWGIDNVVITAQGCNPVWYDWDHIAGTTGPAGDNAVQTVNVVSDTTFTVCYTDGAGFNCCETIAITVNGMGAPTIVTTDETCQGFNDGEVSIIPNGGVGGFTFDITAGPGAPMSNGTGDFSGLAPGTYTVEVTDNGSACTVTETFTIGQGIICCPAPINANSVNTDLLCLQDNSGQIVVNANGGDGGPFNYALNGGAPQAGNSFNGLAAGNHSIDITDNSGCITTINVTLNEPTAVAVIVTTVDASCFGECDGEIFLAPSGGTSPYTFNWIQGIAGPGNAQASNLCAGTYDVEITDDNGCTLTENGIVINEPPAMTIQSINSTDELCSNSCDGTITIVEPTAVSFTIDDGVSQVTQASGNFTNVCAGNYTITVENADGCQATGNVIVDSPNAITLTTSLDTTICENGTAQISANAVGGSAPLTYTWDNGLPAGPTHSVNPTQNTIYNVFVTDANNCQTPVQSVAVNLNPPLQVTALSDQGICPGQSANVSALGSGGDGNYTYNWDDGTGAGPAGQYQTFTPGATTTYTVTLTDGCESTAVQDQLTITINPLPVIDFEGDNLEGCMPVNTQFTNNSTNSGTCLWDFGDGNFSTDCNPAHVFDTPGCYDVTLTVTSPQGCVSTATENSMICVFDFPVADFDFGPQPTSIVAPNILFSNQSVDAAAYEWTFGDGSDISNETNPEHTYPYTEPGQYDVCLIATSSNGCRDTSCQVVIIDGEFLIYVPNAFTPDGDGINDVFMPVITGAEEDSYVLYVFDRWGGLIFETRNLNEGWDGSIRGVVSDNKTDVYTWKIQLRVEDGSERREFIGHVTLLK